jgi:PTS system galactitol-specific IIB component
MVAEKLKEALAEKGYTIETTEVKPTQVESYAELGKYDFVAYTTPVQGNISIPVINAVGFLTGFDEEGFIEEVLRVIEKINAQE